MNADERLVFDGARFGALSSVHSSLIGSRTTCVVQGTPEVTLRQETQALSLIACRKMHSRAMSIRWRPQQKRRCSGQMPAVIPAASGAAAVFPSPLPAAAPLLQQ